MKLLLRCVLTSSGVNPDNQCLCFGSADIAIAERKSRAGVVGEYVEVVGEIADVIAEGVKSGEFGDVNPVIVANFIDALCDMWALRQFAVGDCGVFEINSCSSLTAACPSATQHRNQKAVIN